MWDRAVSRQDVGPSPTCSVRGWQIQCWAGLLCFSSSIPGRAAGARPGLTAVGLGEVFGPKFRRFGRQEHRAGRSSASAVDSLQPAEGNA